MYYKGQSSAMLSRKFIAHIVRDVFVKDEEREGRLQAHVWQCDGVAGRLMIDQGWNSDGQL